MILSNAFIGFLRSECNEDDITFIGMMKLWRAMGRDVENNGYETTLDIMFSNLKKGTWTICGRLFLLTFYVRW